MQSLKKQSNPVAALGQVRTSDLSTSLRQFVSENCRNRPFGSGEKNVFLAILRVHTPDCALEFIELVEQKLLGMLEGDGTQASSILLPHLERAEDTVGVFYDFLRCFGSFRLFPETLSQWVAQQLIWSLAGLWTKLNKDFYSRFFAVETGQPEPPVYFRQSYPPPPVVKWMQLKARKGGRKSSCFLNSVLHGLKKGFMSVPIEDLNAAQGGLKKRLTQVKTVPETILDSVRRASEEVFFDKKHPRLPGHRDFLSHDRGISRNSCVESGRSAGGALGEWVRRSTEMDGNSRLSSLALGFPSLDGVRIRKTSRIGASHLIEKPRENEKKPSGLASDVQGEFIYSSPLYGLDLLPTCCQEEESLHAVLIPEPLKVRVITVNTYDSSASGTGVLQWMRRGLSRFDCFALTREEIENRHIQTVLDGMGDSDLIRSADYSAATDEFPFELSMAAIDPFPYSLREKVRKSLCGRKTIEFIWGRGPTANCYGRRVKGAEFCESFVQTNGQLMGCMYSFPLLCTVNAAILRLAFEIYYSRKYTLRQLPPFLVNGDDLVFAGPKGLIQLWEGLVEQAGLVLSPGKNYDSTSFCVMNSQMFSIRRAPTVSEDGDITGFKPYVWDCPGLVNMGYVTGRQKGWGEDEAGKQDRSVQDGWTSDRLWRGCHVPVIKKLRAIRPPSIALRVTEVLRDRLSEPLDHLGLYDRQLLWTSESPVPSWIQTESLVIEDHFRRVRPLGFGKVCATTDGSWNKLSCRLPEEQPEVSVVTSSPSKRRRLRQSVGLEGRGTEWVESRSLAGQSDMIGPTGEAEIQFTDEEDETLDSLYEELSMVLAVQREVPNSSFLERKVTALREKINFSELITL